MELREVGGLHHHYERRAAGLQILVHAFIVDCLCLSKNRLTAS